jgi:hypothetical protein
MPACRESARLTAGVWTALAALGCMCKIPQACVNHLHQHGPNNTSAHVPTAAGTAYNINVPGYGNVITSPNGATGANTSARTTSPAAQFYFYNATSPTSPLPLAPGASTIIKSEETGKFCRLVPISASSSRVPRNNTIRQSQLTAPAGSMLAMQCDVTDPAQATPMTYTANGLTYNGQPILPVGPGGQMVVVPPGTSTATGTAGTTITSITPAGPVVKPGLYITIETADGYLSVPNTGTSMFPNATATGSNPAEQFVLTSPSGSGTAPIVPGTSTYVQSVATGMYCRVVPGTTANSQEIKCDQPTPATATLMTYTGSGLAYDGMTLGTSGPGKPATVNRGPPVNPLNPAPEVNISGPGVDAMLITPGEHTIELSASC